MGPNHTPLINAGSNGNQQVGSSSIRGTTMARCGHGIQEPLFFTQVAMITRVTRYVVGYDSLADWQHAVDRYRTEFAV